LINDERSRIEKIIIVGNKAKKEISKTKNRYAYVISIKEKEFKTTTRIPLHWSTDLLPVRS